MVGLEKMPCKMPSAMIVSPEPTVIVSTAVPAELVTMSEKVSLVMSISEPVRRSLNVNWNGNESPTRKHSKSTVGGQKSIVMFVEQFVAIPFFN